MAVQTVSAAREEMLGRVRQAIADAEPPPDPCAEPAYRTTLELSGAELLDLFAERVADYRATVTRVTGDGVASALADACREHGAARLGVPAGFPDDGRPDGAELVEDDGLSTEQLDELDGALTGCAVAIAETGTIVLDGAAQSGRRALTLVPDLHLCVVEAEQVVGILPEAIERLEPAVRDGRPLTFVSGPSATSDIELIRVEGVHGPRTLHVVLVG
ncbi:MAG: lactate utilization protein C [Actinomycetota bacterium]